MMVHAAMLKRTYDWCIDAADKPYALLILAAVAFAALLLAIVRSGPVKSALTEIIVSALGTGS